VIQPAALLSDLQRLLKRLEADIRDRCDTNPNIDAPVLREYDKAKSANRTAQAYEVWRDDYITQVAVAWILGCVFVRVLEDNRLTENVWLSGPRERLQLARDQHTVYFQRNPAHSDREYLEYVFAEVAKLPSMRDLLDGGHNPSTKLGPTGDGAHDLLEFWQKIHPATGSLIHEFTDPDWNTRFLGDLYQDLSESARDRYALLQTPEFVEEFILDRTLTPAIGEFGYSRVKMIDPACGSGHFLLGGFRRLLDLRLCNEPGVPVRAHAQTVLDQVYGIDVNPFAVAIARFRLLMAALWGCGIKNLGEAPSYKINLAAGDSLLHGPRLGGEKDRTAYLDGMDPLQHLYETEDADELRRILGQQYHVVVGNPPYITVRDRALNAEYRRRFASCHRQYSLVVPFMERFFHLAHIPQGYVGMITANSFMKREFGKKIIEEYFPRWDLTHVIDTSRAHIPDHGTPTVILFGRSRPPVGETLRAVMGIRAEAKAPTIGEDGVVWRSIVAQVKEPGSCSDYVSVADVPKSLFYRHPWSIRGGGAAELKAELDGLGFSKLGSQLQECGFQIITGEDNCLILDAPVARRLGLAHVRRLGTGEQLLDWSLLSNLVVVWPPLRLDYDVSPEGRRLWRFLWPSRTTLRNRKLFGVPVEHQGLYWWQLRELYADKLRDDLSIAFAFVATHNRFILDKGEAVFKQSAPVMKLAPGTSEDAYLALLGLLNSSVGCFWMKQTYHNKGGGGIGGGLATEGWEQFYEFEATKIKAFPVAPHPPTSLAKQLSESGGQWRQLLPGPSVEGAIPARVHLESNRHTAADLMALMLSLQEELDWHCYGLYKLLDDESAISGVFVPPIALGERAFEIVMARKMAGGELQTTWFERHRSIPITEVPNHWPAEYRELVKQRIALIESNADIALIEQPEYKRRWNMESWEEQERRALSNWLLNRMEDARYWSTLELTSCARLADCLQSDAEFQQVAELYRGRPDFDWASLIVELVEEESVPFLAVLRYTDSGARKRIIWERTWDLQRQEDRVDMEVQADASVPEIRKSEVATKRKAEEIGNIPLPPKYDSKDFRKSGYWSLRGKLDVPKERFICFPHCERDVEATPVIGWAGWNHLQQAQAIAAYYERVKNYEGWTAERRMPLIAGILELLPWLKQWHNDIHPEYHERMGDFFQQFVEDESKAMEKTLDDIRAWTPPLRTGARRRGKTNS
jgi:hypothetical protein